MNKKEILYISYDGMTDNLGQSQVIPYLKGLSQKGYSISILSFEKKGNNHRYNDIHKILSSCNIEWHPLSYTSKPPIISTIWDIMKMKEKAKEIIKKKNISIVHCRSYISAMVGLQLKKSHDIKFVFDMRGFWADERIEGGIWNKINPLFSFVYNFFKSMEIRYINNSDYTISLTESGKNVILNWPQIDKNKKIEVIPCCVDTKHFDYQIIKPSNQQKLQSQLHIPESAITVSYLGSIGTWYMLDEMLDFFVIFQKKYPQAILLFITTDKAEPIFERAEQKGISRNSLRITKANRNEVPLLLSLSQASLFFIKPTFSKKASSPTKMGEIMSMGIPVICNDNVGDVALIMEDSKAGICIHSFDNESYNEATNRFEDILSIPKADIRKAAIKWYSLQDGVSKYEKVYKSILSM